MKKSIKGSLVENNNFLIIYYRTSCVFAAWIISDTITGTIWIYRTPFLISNSPNNTE